MLKKVIAIYIALAVALSGCVTVGVLLLTDYFDAKALQEAMKAENEVAVIDGMFHDQTDLFMEPTAPTNEDEITLRIRTLRYNVTKAQIQYTSDDGVTWTTMDMKFDCHDNTGYYDFWTVTIPPQENFIYYRFLLTNKGNDTTCWYTLAQESKSDGGPVYDEPDYSQCWKLLVGFDTPDWAKGTIWYSIIPDGFFNANTTNDDLTTGTLTANVWGLGKYTNKNLNAYYGGDIEGIAEKVGYIKSLGVESIFANPVHRGAQTVGYGAYAYKEVEGRFGTLKTYKDLMSVIHANDMHYMQDVDLAYVAQTNLWRGHDYFVTGESSIKDVFTSAHVAGWGGEVLDLGKTEAQKLIWTEEDSYLQYLLKEVGVDGFRFDTGGWLWGATETKDLSANEVMQSMRTYLKKVNPEVFLLSESSGTTPLKDGAFDSEWNRSAETLIQGYAQGLTSSTGVMTILKNHNLMLPRSVGHTIYNYTSQHDLSRVYGNDYQMKAAVTLLYGFVGSPCIYWGEENVMTISSDGVSSGDPFTYFDWNPSNWDYGMRAHYTAMAELRQNYSAVKTGAYKTLAVDDIGQYISFARFDKNGSVVFAINQNEDIKEHEVDMRTAGVADGEVVTDWLTGKEYTVKDGKIIANIIPGGTAFVTGGKSATFRQAYKVSNLGSDATIVTTDVDAFYLEGNGKLTGKADAVKFAGVESFGEFEISAGFKTADGEAALMVRNSNSTSSAFYAAVIGKGKLTVTYRTTNGAEVKTVAAVTVANDSVVRITRGADNTLTTYVAALNADGSEGTWTVVSGSEIKINLDNQVKSGFAPISGKVSIVGLAKKALEGLPSETFNNATYSALLNGLSTSSDATLADGYLTLKASGQMATFTAYAPSQDYTFKTALKYAPASEGDRAGLIVRGSSQEWISVGRTVENGKSVIYFGKATGGIFNILYTAEDTNPNDEVVVQIQKIGAVYSAIYSYDGVNWEDVGDTYIYMNFPENNVGLLLEGTVDSKYNYACFGDSINDGKSTNTPHTPHTINMSFTDNELADKSNNWTNGGGTWVESDQGVTQTDKTVLGIMTDSGRLYSNFRAQAVFSFNEGEGWAGMGFGKASPISGPTEGFALKFTTDKKVALYKGETKIAEVGINIPDGDSLKVSLEANNKGEIFVYVGEDSILALHLENTGYVNGYFCYYTEGVNAEIGNYAISDTIANWAVMNGSFVGAGNSLTVMNGVVTNLTGVAMSNFVLQVQLTVNPTTTAIAAAQVVLSAPQGASGDRDGVMLQLDQYGRLSLWEKGFEKAAYQMENPPEKGRVKQFAMVVKQNGTYKVYIPGKADPVLSYTEDFVRGGVIAFSAYASTCKYTRLSFENITSETDLNTVKTYTDFLSGKSAAELPLPAYKEEFNSQASWSNLVSYSGDWVIKDGALHCTSTNAWDQRVLVSSTPYDNFRITFDMKSTGGGSWFGVSIRSSKPSANHASGSTGGIAIIFNRSGGFYTFIDATNQNDNSALNPIDYKKGPVPGFKTDEFFTVTIEAINESIKVYSGGVLLAECTDDGDYEGYIRFISGTAMVAFDNLIIEPILVD